MVSSDYSTLERNRHQFSVRDLFVLTLLVSVVLTIAVLSRGSRYFSVLSSLWTWVSLSLPAAVWVINRRQMAARRWFVGGSIAAYLISLAAPAFTGGSDIEFGFKLWAQSYVFGLGCALELLDPTPPSPPGIFNVHISAALPFACLLGALANSLMILGWITLGVARYRKRPTTVVRWMACGAFALMLACIVPICISTDTLKALLPGYGLWLASAVMLALGVRNQQLQQKPQLAFGSY